jgi:hypothetical protein
MDRNDCPPPLESVIHLRSAPHRLGSGTPVGYGLDVSLSPYVEFDFCPFAPNPYHPFYVAMLVFYAAGARAYRIVSRKDRESVEKGVVFRCI